MILTAVAVFFATIAGGVVVYEYSRWRTLCTLKDKGLFKLIPNEEELLKVEGD